MATYLNDVIFMFQKELGNKIIGKFTSKHYGRLSILTHFRLNILKISWSRLIAFFQNLKLPRWRPF